MVAFAGRAFASISAILNKNRYVSVAPVTDEPELDMFDDVTLSGTSAPPSVIPPMTAEEMAQTINIFYGSRLTVPTEELTEILEETNDTVAETTE